MAMAESLERRFNDERVAGWDSFGRRTTGN